jgi:hypothetical protein
VRRITLALGALSALFVAVLGAGVAPASAAPEAPQRVVVTKQYGAALHTAPSSDADVGFSASCGDSFPVLDVQDGWYQVMTAGGPFWVGGARVADAAAPPVFDCSNAVTFPMDSWAAANVQSGCLSQRLSPSREAAIEQCVDNGTQFRVTGGPVEVAGEDWLRVWSPGYPDGWVLAQFLVPALPQV